MTWRAAAMAAVSFLVLFAAQAIADAPEVAHIEQPKEDGRPLNPADVHMVAEFSDGDGDEHVCSQWEIRTRPQGELAWASDTPYEDKCMDGEEKVHIHLGDGTFLNSYEGRSELKPQHAYSLRVRFLAEDSEGNQEWSPWEERWFDTREAGSVGSETQSWKAREGYTVETFAGGLRLPTNIAMVSEPGDHPGDPLMYVTELYGAVKVITRDGTVGDYETELLNFNPTGNFPGSGEMGVTGIVVEPETGDVFVSMVYEDEGVHRPKVVRLISDDAGLEAIGEETVLDMKSARQGASHQVSNLAISPDGHLFVHNGDGGDGSGEAPNLDSYLGKILRMTLDGEPVDDASDPNPHYDPEDGISERDYVYASGIRNAFGGAWRLSDETYWMVENGPAVDRLAKVLKGEDYGWPGDPEMSHLATYNWDPPHAPVNIAFVESQRQAGSEFPPETMGHAFVTESGSTWATGPQANGKRIVEFDVETDGDRRSGPEMLAEYTGVGKATAVGLAAGPDGLYFTDLYKDTGYGSPVDRGANVLRVRYCGSNCPDDPPDATPPDETPPTIDGFKVRRKVFAVGLGPRLKAVGSRLQAGTSAARRGTAFVYNLSERSRVWIGIKPFVTGWRLRNRSNCRLFSRQARKRLRRTVGLRRCVLPEQRGVRRAGKGCRRGTWNRGRGRIKRFRCVLRGPRGVIRGSGKPGHNVRLYAGKIRRRWLHPGHYLGIVRARDLSNNVAKPRFTAFRVVPRR